MPNTLLVRAQHVGNTVKLVTLLNLGRHVHVPQKDWKLLYAKVEHILFHQKDLLPLHVPENIDFKAHRTPHSFKRVTASPKKRHQKSVFA